jgi:hypothetical protein
MGGTHLVAGVAVVFVWYTPCRVKEDRIPVTWLNALTQLRLHVGDASRPNEATLCDAPLGVEWLVSSFAKRCTRHKTAWPGPHPSESHCMRVCERVCVCLVRCCAESRLVPQVQLHAPMTEAVLGEGKLKIRLRHKNGKSV